MYTEMVWLRCIMASCMVQVKMQAHSTPSHAAALSPAPSTSTADGTVILHSLHGRYERSIVPPQRHAIDAVAIAPGHGVVALYTSLGPALWLYSINGTPLATAVPPPGLRCLAIGPDGQTLLPSGVIHRLRLHKMTLGLGLGLAP